MTQTIPAIETHYAGCRFRSRLEARWAVFFDALDIEWQYEPQGYKVGPKRTRYLPDFWLPRMTRWVEVKGAMSASDFETLIWAASEIGLPDGPGTAFDKTVIPVADERILILGEIPDPDTANMHWRLDVTNEGRPILSRFFFYRGNDRTYRDYQIFAPMAVMDLVDQQDRPDDADGLLALVTRNTPLHLIKPLGAICDAYRAARSARFEHGESGTPERVLATFARRHR